MLVTNPEPDGRAGLITMEYVWNLEQLSNKEHELLFSMETVSFINKPIAKLSASFSQS